jgi:hypothetical protein
MSWVMTAASESEKLKCRLFPDLKFYYYKYIHFFKEKIQVIIDWETDNEHSIEFH